MDSSLLSSCAPGSMVVCPVALEILVGRSIGAGRRLEVIRRDLERGRQRRDRGTADGGSRADGDGEVLRWSLAGLCDMRQQRRGFLFPPITGPTHHIPDLVKGGGGLEKCNDPREFESWGTGPLGELLTWVAR